MCNRLLFSYLLLIFNAWAISTLEAQELQPIYQNRTIDLHNQVQEQLYKIAISQIQTTHQGPDHNFSIEKDHLVSLLNVRYPELVYQLENTPRQIVSQQEISKLLLSIIDENSAQGHLDIEGSLWSTAKSTIDDSEGIATLEFLYGYELFKQKQLKEAQKKFSRLALMRKGPYEYALYYGAIASLLQSDFTEAIAQFKRIGKTEELQHHIPYYLSAAHYGRRDYTSVLKFYENRIHETQLFNIDGMTKIVAYSNYHLKNYHAAITNLDILSNYRNLTEEEKYVLGKSLINTGQNKEGNELLSQLVGQSQEHKLKQTASYEYAIILSREGKYEQAKAMFQSMLTEDKYSKEDLRYNLTLIEAKMSNYNEAAHIALSLIKGKYQESMIALLSKILDHIEDPTTYIAVVESIDIRSKNKASIKSSLYKRAVAALQKGEFASANSFFEKLKTIDPLIEERGAVAGWKGIMAYHNADFKSAQRLLSNYINSTSTHPSSSETDNELKFNVHYFLAYSAFKLKSHKTALGYFSKSLDLIKDSSDKLLLEDINLRIGDSYFLMNQYELATESYNAAELLNLSHRPYALWQKAVIAELQNTPYDQLLILDDIIGTHPDSKYYGRALFSSANTLFSLGKYDKSAKLYKRLENEPVAFRMKEEAIIQLGLISVNAGAYDDAERYYSQILNSSEDKELQHRAHLALKEIYADYTYDTDAYLQLVKTNSSKAQIADDDKIIFDLAMDNFESGNFASAITQWNKLIEEHPNSAMKQEAQFQIGIAYQKQDDNIKSMDAYRATTLIEASDWSKKAYDQMEGIALNVNKDHELYLQLIIDRKQDFPSYSLTPSQTYKGAQSAVTTNNVLLSKNFTIDLFALNSIAQKEKNEILSKTSSLLMKEKKWKLISDMLTDQNLKGFVETSPKFTYTRSLAYMNQSQLDNAIESITGSYSVLLNDPAWLAKSIILLSDIYTIKGEKDNAIAALQALIETKSEVPSSLIELAKNRLELIQPQN